MDKQGKVKPDLAEMYNGVLSAIDFISSNTDADETGLYEEMIPPLNSLLAYLKVKISQSDKRLVNRTVKEILKKRGLKP